MRSDKGVTIVSMVVTIIIMIIIATTVILEAIGKNGIITMALKAAGIYLYDQSEEHSLGGTTDDNFKKMTIDDLIEYFEPHKDQTKQGIVGISQTREEVNMDYWELTETEDGFNARYVGPIVDGTYVGQMPTFVKVKKIDETYKKGYVLDYTF